MAKRLWLWAALALIIGTSAGVVNLQPALACGGFFCQNSPAKTPPLIRTPSE
ncbi:MAG: hypothetical protein O2909_09725 [Chloroflexi bacterium]|nr:hypothetical protein [Chloroflexota bacterium]